MFISWNEEEEKKSWKGRETSKNQFDEAKVTEFSMIQRIHNFSAFLPQMEPKTFGDEKKAEREKDWDGILLNNMIKVIST